MPDWRALCRGPHIDLDDDGLVVRFENGRAHRVHLEETATTVEVLARVAGRAAVQHVRDLPKRIWLHNRESQLVSFHIDARGRVGARGWAAKAGLTAEELQLVVRRVAAESDRLEFLLTGRDVE